MALSERFDKVYLVKTKMKVRENESINLFRTEGQLYLRENNDSESDCSSTVRTDSSEEENEDIDEL